jgi:hypothetical protein
MMSTAPLKSTVGFARRLLEDARSVGRVARGALHFARTGTTPADAYHSLIWLHCRTNGRSNDWLHALVRRRSRAVAIRTADGVLGKFSEADLACCAEQIRREGYFRFDVRLPADVCDRLAAFARSMEAVTSPPRDGCPARAIYDPTHPIAEAYRFEEQVLVGQPDIQTLMADPSLIALAQAYLGCMPVLSVAAMWWSTSARFSDAAKAELAQMYHFDMDRIKWLKFFFYLNDVTSDSGPHCFIAKSHRAGHQPPSLLKRGYVRIRDEELETHYPPEDRIEITGPRGSIFAADTRGFHKGITPRKGDRLLLQLEFCDTLFGASYMRPSLSAGIDSELAVRMRAFPRLYSRYQ